MGYALHAQTVRETARERVLSVGGGQTAQSHSGGPAPGRSAVAVGQ